MFHPVTGCHVPQTQAEAAMDGSKNAVTLEDEFPSLLVSDQQPKSRKKGQETKNQDTESTGSQIPCRTVSPHPDDESDVRPDVCQCPPHLLMQANKNAVSHSTHCPEFRCSLCRNNFSSNFVLTHTESSTHKGKFRTFIDDLFLMSLPPPPPSVRDDVLSSVLQETARKNELEPESLALIHQTIERLNLLIQKEVNPRVSVRLFGSVLTGTAIRRRSDVNLDLVIQRRSEEVPEPSDGTDEENAAQILSRIADLMQRNQQLFPNVDRDFGSSCPRVKFSVMDPETEKPFSKVRSFEILLSGQRTLETSKLLHKYVQLDERVRVLCICVRVWSAVCLLDDQESGTWPPHAFSLLLISFLQRIRPHPVLPFLQSAAAKITTDNKNDEEPVIPAPTESSAPGPDERSEDEQRELEAMESVTWVTRNEESVGQLWLSFLRFYGLQFRAGVDVVSVRRPPEPDREISHSEKGWGTRIMAIEEPFRPWLNLSRSVGSREIFANFLHLIRQTYVYFATPQLQEGPAFKMSNFEIVYKPMTRRRLTSCGLTNDDCVDDIEPEDEGEESSDEAIDDEDDNESDGSSARVEDSSRPFRLATQISRRHGIILQLSPDVQSSLEKLDPNKLKYRFNFATLDWFRNIKKFCHSCRKSGHTARSCPTESLPRIVELPLHFPDEVLSFHSRIYESLFQEERISDEAHAQHEIVRQDLLSLIRSRLLPDAELQLFGSCINGFGSSSSDMDLCLTLASDPTGKSLDQKRLESMIQDLGKLLHSHGPVLKSSILPIVHAKVPIVKFTYILISENNRRRDIQCDLSLYNVLGCCNTRLLRTYCQLDPRVPVLGFVVKHFAKTCDIADASRGSLSSYAYTLMTIHFLQREGVIPVLQEMGWTATTPTGRPKAPEVMVDGWNTWFVEDVEEIRRSWRPSNNACVARLFIRFLQYYAQEFSFADYVVCCRRSQPLTRLEKMWTGKRIAIEDPFLLTHNLGAGLAPQMATFIQSSLILAHNHFGQALAYVKPPVMPQLPPLSDGQHHHPAVAAAMAQDRHMQVLALQRMQQQQLRDEIAFLFNPKMLTNGSLPTGRGCRLCGRIAHRVKDCPLRRTGRTGGQQQSLGPARVFACFACGSPRHKVNACPQAAAQRSPAGPNHYRPSLQMRGPPPFQHQVQRHAPPFAMNNGIRGHQHQQGLRRNPLIAPGAGVQSFIRPEHQPQYNATSENRVIPNQLKSPAPGAQRAGSTGRAMNETQVPSPGFRRMTVDQLMQQHRQQERQDTSVTPAKGRHQPENERTPQSPKTTPPSQSKKKESGSRGQSAGGASAGKRSDDKNKGKKNKQKANKSGPKVNSGEE